MLYPKEHGAYAMLAIPLLTALITSCFTLIGICVAAATATGFLAHEPLLIVWGHRGQRARQSAPQARYQLTSLLVITLATGLTAMILGSVSLRLALTICFAFAAISYAFSIVGWHRKTAVHLWGMLGLSMPCVPILLAGGAGLLTALTFWTVWLIGFASTTLGVRGMMANHKHKSRRLHILTLIGLSLTIAIGSTMNANWLLVTLPMVAVSWYLLIAPPPIKQIKQTGWMLVIGALSTAIMTVFVFGRQ